MRLSAKNSVDSIRMDMIAKMPVGFPRFEEQQKIATFLTGIDERINVQIKIIDNLESLKQGTMQKVFNGKWEVKSGKRKFIPPTLRFKNNDGGDFIDWKEKKLGEITKCYDGTHQTPKYVSEGIPFYSVEHVTADQFEITKYISSEVFEKENKKVKLQKGDILMTKIGTVGKAKYIDWDVNASFYVSLALIKKNKDFNGLFVSYLVNNVAFQKELWKRTIHVAFPEKINLGEIGECIMMLPCIIEQTKIANTLLSIDKRIEAEKEILEQYKQQKRYLLQNLFI